ncbi:hypothetical protein FGB62_339g013 [Gracilaria domingensis]|nr:hypothetical protein FGB62_339g013 [Gracilaria domingensis]
MQGGVRAGQERWGARGVVVAERGEAADGDAQERGQDAGDEGEPRGAAGAGLDLLQRGDEDVCAGGGHWRRTEAQDRRRRRGRGGQRGDGAALLRSGARFPSWKFQLAWCAEPRHAPRSAAWQARARAPRASRAPMCVTQRTRRAAVDANRHHSTPPCQPFRSCTASPAPPRRLAASAQLVSMPFPPQPAAPIPATGRSAGRAPLRLLLISAITSVLTNSLSLPPISP